MTIYPLIIRIGSFEITGYGLMMMVAFQEVDGIERLQALALSFGVSAVVYLVVAFLT